MHGVYQTAGLSWLNRSFFKKKVSWAVREQDARGSKKMRAASLFAQL